jgi:hypothetical protein
MIAHIRAWWAWGSLVNRWRDEVQRIGPVCLAEGMSQEEIRNLAWENVRPRGSR